MNLADVYRTTIEYTFFFLAYGTFSRIDHILDHKVTLNKFQKMKSYSTYFVITMK
jgi:hypothetical protein